MAVIVWESGMLQQVVRLVNQGLFCEQVKVEMQKFLQQPCQSQFWQLTKSGVHCIEHDQLLSGPHGARQSIIILM